MIGAVLLLLLASSAATEWLGIHALFGAFALGAVMPKERGFVHDLSSKLEDFTVVFLLPIFFALTGLKTSIGLVSGEEMWGYAGLVLAVAVAGKFGGSAIAARVTGLDWRESGALGILMNTRGLMELVILTIGLELGVISPALFAMMVLMALVTTAMTTPVLELLYPARLIRQVTAGDVEAEHEHTVLLPISLPSSGPGLLRAALALAPEGRLPRIYALYLERASNQPQYGAQALEDVLRPVLEEAAARGVEVRPLSFVTRDPARDIIDVARVRRADLVLMGWHKPILGKSILSGTVSAVLRGAPADAAVLVDRGGAEWQSILVPYRDPVADRAALEMARRIAAAGPARVTILHVVTPERRTGGSLSRSFEEHAFPDGVTLKVIESDSPVDAAVREAREGYDLIVVGASRSWGTAPTALGQRHEELARAGQASLLVVRGGDVETEPADAEVRGLAASAAAS
jgi:nucleotide-binding universal stress UspA family protein